MWLWSNFHVKIRKNIVLYNIENPYIYFVTRIKRERQSPMTTINIILSFCSCYCWTKKGTLQTYTQHKILEIKQHTHNNIWIRLHDDNHNLCKRLTRCVDWWWYENILWINNDREECLMKYARVTGIFVFRIISRNNNLE